MLSVDGFNELNWRSQCDFLAEQSSKGCGLSHTVFVDKFSSAVDSALFQLSPDERIPLLEIAREWDYATPQERHDEQIDCAESGYCSHGIEFGCCPAGCEEPPSLEDQYLEVIQELKDKLDIAENTIVEANQRCTELALDEDELELAERVMVAAKTALRKGGYELDADVASAIGIARQASIRCEDGSLEIFVILDILGFLFVERKSFDHDLQGPTDNRIVLKSQGGRILYFEDYYAEETVIPYLEAIARGEKNTYVDNIQDLSDKIGVVLDQMESLELENHALEYELSEANQRCEHFIGVFEAEKSKVDFYRKHPIKAFFGLLPQAIKE
jgi:hypothetical protein